MNIQQQVFKLAYEISPIILTNGIASVSGNYLPIIALTEPLNFGFNILNGANALDFNNFFGHFKPMTGSTLIDNDVAMYPFANSSIAANAIIAKPKRISMMMLCPANRSGGLTNKLITFTALKRALDAHNQSGGTYIVATPSFIYTDCILTSLTDASGQDSHQVQNAYQFDFIQPLTTLNQAEQVLNSLMGKISRGLPTPTNLTSLSNTLDTPVSNLASINTGIGGTLPNPTVNLFS